MRNTLSSTKIVNSMEECAKIVKDDTIEFSTPIMLDEGAVRMVFNKKPEFIREHKVSNIVLSLWTTSAARIKLYEYIENVYKEEGGKPLYCDTGVFGK